MLMVYRCSSGIIPDHFSVHFIRGQGIDTADGLVGSLSI